jgi:DNA-binding response OmpR family regulator
MTLERRARIEPSQTKMLKILVVDDEASIRELLSHQLMQQGRRVIVASDGQTAIEMFRRERPDITILDLQMPDLGGIAVLQAIRAIDPAATVMIFTGLGTEAAEAQARELGVTEFLCKGDWPEILSKGCKAGNP